MRACLIVPFALCLAVPGAAQVVSGRVVAGDSAPVAAARVRLIPGRGDTLAAMTDAAGRFTFHPGAAGTVRLSAQAAGLRAALSPEIELARGDSLVVRLWMFPDTVLLNPLEVVASARQRNAWARAFYRRAQDNAWGWFVTREQIRRATLFRTSDLLWGVPGITLVPARVGFGYAVRGPRGCVPAVYLDGMRLRGGAAIDEWTTPLELEGIEVYTNGGAPAEFTGPGSGCAVIALWTRARR